MSSPELCSHPENQKLDPTIPNQANQPTKHVAGSPSAAHVVRTEQGRKQLNFCTSWKNSFTVSPSPVKKVAI